MPLDSRPSNLDLPMNPSLMTIPVPKVTLHFPYKPIGTLSNLPEGPCDRTPAAVRWSPTRWRSTCRPDAGALACRWAAGRPGCPVVPSFAVFHEGLRVPFGDAFIPLTAKREPTGLELTDRFKGLKVSNDSGLYLKLDNVCLLVRTWLPRGCMGFKVLGFLRFSPHRRLTTLA